MERNRLVKAVRGRPRSAEANDAILSAAIALVREVGYDDVTVEAIADRAGVGKATIYRRWPSKEAIVTEAIGRIVSVIPIPDTGTLRGDLRLLMRSTARMYGDRAQRGDRRRRPVRICWDPAWRGAPSGGAGRRPR